MVKLNVGEKFPEIKGDTFEGEISGTEFRGKNAVVYFYPKDNTPGCTREAKDFRDYKKDFDELDTRILGISTDSAKSHKKFAEKYDLNFPLLSDKGNILCSACGVKGIGGITAKRTTFLVDKTGVIRYIWEKVDVNGHAEDVLKKIRELDLL